MWLWAGVPERKLTFVAYKGSKTDKTGHAAHAKHSWSYTVLLITFVWRDAEAQEHLFLLTFTVTKLVSAQLQVQDVDKIGKEIKYKKTGNIVRNRNSWGVYKNSIWRLTDRNSNHAYSVTTRIRPSVYNPLGNTVGARLLVSFMRRWKDKQLWVKTLSTKH